MAGLTDDYLTVEETAQLLGETVQTVRALIKARVLPAKRWRGRLWIAKNEIPQFEQRRNGSIVVGRRGFLQRGIAAVAGVVALVTFYEEVQSHVVQPIEEYIQARSAFADLFGSLVNIKGPFGITLGRPNYTGWEHPYHPGNWGTGVSIGGALGVANIADHIVENEEGLPWSPQGDLLVIGGANSTSQTMVAWEADGPNDRELSRPDEPIIPLRFYGVSSTKHPVMAELEPLAYDYQYVGTRESVPWPYVEMDISTGRPVHLHIPVLGSQTVQIEGREVKIPETNYLLVTSLPNFLDPSFGRWLRGGEYPELYERERWPHMVIFGGSNGIGTRAAELLATPTGKRALEAAVTELKGAREFQILFETSEIYRTDGYHQCHAIKLVPGGVYRFFEDGGATVETFRRAHVYAMERRWRNEPTGVTSLG